MAEDEKNAYLLSDGEMFEVERMPRSEMELPSKGLKKASWVYGTIDIYDNISHADKTSFKEYSIIPEYHSKMRPLPKGSKKTPGAYTKFVIDNNMDKLFSKEISKIKFNFKYVSLAKDDWIMPKKDIFYMPDFIPKNKTMLNDLISLYLERWMTHKDNRQLYSILIHKLNPEKEPKIRQHIISEICDSLEQMKQSGNVDRCMFANAEELRKFLRKTKDRWRKYPDLDGMAFYGAVRNAGLVLDSMDERFEGAREPADIIKAAKDSLTVMPHIRDILDAADVDRPTDPSRRSIIYKTHRLLVAAADAGLNAALIANVAKLDDRARKIVAEHLAESVDRALDGVYGNKHGRPRSRR